MDAGLRTKALLMESCAQIEKGAAAATPNQAAVWSGKIGAACMSNGTRLVAVPVRLLINLMQKALKFDQKVAFGLIGFVHLEFFSKNIKKIQNFQIRIRDSGNDRLDPG